MVTALFGSYTFRAHLCHSEKRVVRPDVTLAHVAVTFHDNLFSLADCNPENQISALHAKVHVVPLHDVPGPALLPAGPLLLLQVYHISISAWIEITVQLSLKVT